MKESTGGALLMGLAAGIIIIFIIMVAFFISFSKTFKIKNSIINRIEQNEGMTQTELDEFLANETSYNGENRICYNVVKNNNSSIIGVTFNVTIYMQMDRTILGEAFNVKIPISGETRIIEKGNFFNNIKNQRRVSGYSECWGE